MGRIVGGFMCAMSDCNNNSGVDRHKYSFFRFPSNTERAKLWLQACGIKKEIPQKKLYNNYRVCSKHFASNMFLNDLKNRLQPHAIPSTIHNEAIDVATTTRNEIIVETSTESATINLQAVVPNNDNASCSTTNAGGVDLSINLNENFNATNNDVIKLKDNKGTQTELQLSNSTPRKKALRRKCDAAEKRAKRIKLKHDNEKADIIENITYSDFQKLLYKFYPKPMADFMKTQGDNLNKKKSGNRFTVEFKMFCLNLYFKGPKAYRVLSNTFILPSKRTLERTIEGLIISPGLHNIIFERLKIKTENLCSLDKYCCISMDTMSLKASLFYMINRDEVIGFHDTGYTKKFLTACNVAIIMVRGLTNKFKQPLGYFFLHSSVDANELRTITIECVEKLQNIDLKVIAEVTDMGSDYMKAAKKLGVTQQTPFYTVNEQKIFYFLDPPHLLKAARNNLLNNNITSGDKIISWQHIEKLYEIDKENVNRLVPKLNQDTHINPNNFQRMKVKYAAQVLSFSVSSAINTMIALGQLPTSAKDTSEYIEKLDAAFDMFNSSLITDKKPSRNAFTASEKQLEFLKSLKSYFYSLKVFTKEGKNITNKINVFKFWMQNINSLNQMWIYLNEIQSGFQFLLLRRINQDIIEHTFGEIRNLSGNSFNPTPVQFYYSFRKSFAINHCSIETGNCTLEIEESETEMINKITQFKQETFVQNTPLQKTIAVDIDDHDYRHKDVVEENAFYYICGYLMSKCLKKHSCDICKNFAKDVDNFNSNRYYTLFRASRPTEENMYGGLCVPNQKFVEYVENLDNIFFNKLDTLILNECILAEMITYLEIVVCPHPCKDFPKKYFNKLYARVRLYFTLKFTNRRFKGQEKNKKLIILTHN